VLGQTNALDIGLTVIGVLRKALGQSRGSAAGGSIFKDRYQLINKVGVG
jgi:hypothetical protein